MSPRPALSRRQRRIRFSLALSAAGLAVVALGGYWLQQARQAELLDTRDAVTVSSVAEIPDDAPALTFHDAAAELAIRMRHGAGERSRILPEDTGSGLAWGDIDGDGDFDLYVVNFPGDPKLQSPDAAGQANADGGTDWNRLYRNDGTSFTDVTRASGTADPLGFGMGASFADFDDDGDLDLYVTNWGPNRLFRNRGDGTFEEVASELGIDDPRWSVGVTWGDFDRDGLLDLYVANYVDIGTDIGTRMRELTGDDPNWQGIPLSLNPNAFSAQPNRLYRQLPAGGFEDVALESGASNPGGRSLAATAVDLDGDGWLDLYIANDVSPNALLLNLGARLGEALFEDASSYTGTADPRGSMGISVTDLAHGEAGGDGLPDLFVTHWVAQENALYQALRIGAKGLEYRDKTRSLGLGEISTSRVGWGCAFVDLDLDGRRDLVVANGSTLETGAPAPSPPRLVPQPLFVFWNTGDGFADLASRAGPALTQPHVARGLAAADYDGDGDVDLAVAVNRGQPLLLRNDLAHDHSWLAVRLRGPAARTFGARVEVVHGGRRQIAWWGADVSFASGHAPELLFGLGTVSADTTTEVSVVWLGGQRSEVLDVPDRQRLFFDYPAPEGQREE